MASYSNEELLSGILRNDSSVLRYIYKKCYQKINTFITRNSGDVDEANDIFQEAIIVIYRKLKDDNLTLKDCSFETYLYSVSKLLWLKYLKKRRNNIVIIDDILTYSDEVYDDDLIETVKKNERYKLFQDHFLKLGTDCQKILKLFFDKVPFKQIADIMGYTSEGYAKKRKHQCKEALVNNIKQDTEFKNIRDNET
jgi:RNA polymerase sigma factor (sigma-70 family)